MLSGIILGSNGVIQFDVPEAEEEVWTSKKETIYVWYVDAALEKYLSSAAVAFGEKEEWLMRCYSSGEQTLCSIWRRGGTRHEKESTCTCIFVGQHCSFWSPCCTRCIDNRVDIIREDDGIWNGTETS